MTSNKKSSLTKNLAQRIIKLREERGISSVQLANKIGMSKSGLRYIERDLKDPRAETLALIADGLNVPLVELFNFEAEQ
ncbi:MAG: helix-turn-helix transcriptional regulator [Spirochaetia bacterium]|nr:helix-turn-helix transcriptional regulator [Spirochaetia bacterium]